MTLRRYDSGKKYLSDRIEENGAELTISRVVVHPLGIQDIVHCNHPVVF